jgi:hypothetical protein
MITNLKTRLARVTVRAIKKFEIGGDTKANKKFSQCGVRIFELVSGALHHTFKKKIENKMLE